MPFIEHRGTGKSPATSKFDSMPELWDKTWADQEVPKLDLSKTEHWQWLKQFMPPPARVLEAGCGKGQWVRSLDELGYEAYGVDFAANAIENALKQLPHLKLIVGDLRTMTFEDDFFDWIMSLGAVEHDPNGPLAALKEMYRVLKPGGFLYCTVPCINRIRAMGLLAIMDWVICNKSVRRATGRTPEVQFYEYVYYPEEYGELLRSVGFEVIDLAPLSPHIVWRRGPLLSKLVDFVHRRNPLMTCHMIAGVCRKPKRN